MLKGTEDTLVSSESNLSSYQDPAYSDNQVNYPTSMHKFNNQRSASFKSPNSMQTLPEKQDLIAQFNRDLEQSEFNREPGPLLDGETLGQFGFSSGPSRSPYSSLSSISNPSERSESRRMRTRDQDYVLPESGPTKKSKNIKPTEIFESVSRENRNAEQQVNF